MWNSLSLCVCACLGGGGVTQGEEEGLVGYCALLGWPGLALGVILSPSVTSFPWWFVRQTGPEAEARAERALLYGHTSAFFGLKGFLLDQPWLLQGRTLGKGKQERERERKVLVVAGGTVVVVVPTTRQTNLDVSLVRVSFQRRRERHHVRKCIYTVEGK